MAPIFIIIIVLVYIVGMVLRNASRNGGASARRGSSAQGAAPRPNTVTPQARVNPYPARTNAPRVGAYPGADSGTSRPVTPVSSGSYEPGLAHTTVHTNHSAHLAATRPGSSAPAASRRASENYRSSSDYSYATKLCPHCHKAMNQLSKFCPNCGKDTLGR